MTERGFFKLQSSLTVREIAALTGAEPRSGAPLDQVISNVAPLDLAGPGDVTFIEQARYADSLAETRASACLMNERFESNAPPGLIVLRTKEPYRAFIAVQRTLFPDSMRPSSIFGAEGVAPGAIVHSTARLESGVTVDPGVVIGRDVKIGAGTIIGANATIGVGVQIGRDCAIGANCAVTHALIGDRVVIHPGCCIGQDGFGYVPGKSGLDKVPQIGRVIIQDDVEIGAGTAIDRGGIRDTFIGEGTKIDNLCQIAHNCQIGRHCIIVAQSGLSGSVTLEDYVVLGGSVGIIDHITVGKGAKLAARSNVMRDVPPGAQWGGVGPAKPLKQAFREVVILERLARRADDSDKQDD